MVSLVLRLANSMVRGRMAASQFIDALSGGRRSWLDAASVGLRSHVHPALQLAGVPVCLPLNDRIYGELDGEIGAVEEDRYQQDQLHLWFAAPKKQVTRHKKRLKTTVQKRISLRTDIIIDPRTGQITRKHRLPANWKDYVLDPSQTQQ